MRFNPKARLDTSRVRDAGRTGGGGPRRRAGPSGGLGGGLGGALGNSRLSPGRLGGGGIVGLVIAVVVYVVVSQVNGATPSAGGSLDTSRFADSGRYASCRSGADANASDDCARVAEENSLSSFWSAQLGSRFHPEAAIITFDGQISTGCGPASEAVGPFYCPTDQTIYLDTGFFDDVLNKQLGGPDGGFVQAYVLAHEYGHHIQNLMGTMSQVKGDTGPQSSSVRLELQADCYAGMWARSATTTEDADGNVLIDSLSRADIAQALAAAASVGDDRIEEKTRGQVDEETWTHGSAAQRTTWFRTGYTQATLAACDTFAAPTV